MRELPRRLMTHRCVLRKYRTDISLFTRELVSQTVLSRVRIAPSKRCISDTRQNRTRCGGVLYYDAHISLPEEAEFIEEGLDSVIYWRGHEYPVTGAAYIYDDTELHHIELMLGGAQ